MTNRRLLDPNSLSAEPSPIEVREALVDLWWLASMHRTRETGDYSVSGQVRHEIITMANTTSATVTFAAKPDDMSIVTAIRTDAQVTIDFDTKTYGPTGASTLVLASVGSAPTLLFDEDDGEWWPML